MKGGGMKIFKNGFPVVWKIEVVVFEVEMK